MKEAALSVPAAEFRVARRRSDGGGRRGRTLRSCGISARQWQLHITEELCCPTTPPPSALTQLLSTSRFLFPPHS
ncbi:uncharacterized protein ACO6RY_10949 [Pungitius sinensis]